MSRLIDADELYNGSMKHEYFDFVEHDNHGRESYAYSCAMQRVAEAPTVEAVPVSWLESVRNDADEAGDLEMRDAITGLIYEWNRRANNG